MKAARLLLAFAVGWGFIYLMGAFVNVSFDVKTWSMEARFIVATFGMFGGGVWMSLTAEAMRGRR